jgi:hypothetical protein
MSTCPNLALGEADDLQLGADPVQRDHGAELETLVPGRRRHDDPGRVVPEALALADLRLEEGPRLDPEQGEVDLAPVGGLGVDDRDAHRLRRGDAGVVAPDGDLLRVDDRAGERVVLPGPLVEGEGCHGHRLEPGDTVVDQARGEAGQHHHEDRHEGDHQAHEPEPAAGETQFAQRKEHESNLVCLAAGPGSRWTHPFLDSMSGRCSYRDTPRRVPRDGVRRCGPADRCPRAP